MVSMKTWHLKKKNQQPKPNSKTPCRMMYGRNVLLGRGEPGPATNNCWCFQSPLCLELHEEYVLSSAVWLTERLLAFLAA